MNYELKGKVVEVFPIQTFGANGFQKREFRVREISDSKYPNIVPFILKKDKCAIGDSLYEGAEVNVHFNLNGHLYDKGDGTPVRCFCDNECWKIDLLSAPKSSSRIEPIEVPEETSFEDATDEDIPF